MSSASLLLPDVSPPVVSEFAFTPLLSLSVRADLALRALKSRPSSAFSFCARKYASLICFCFLMHASLLWPSISPPGCLHVSLSWLLVMYGG